MCFGIGDITVKRCVEASFEISHPTPYFVVEYHSSHLCETATDCALLCVNEEGCRLAGFDPSSRRCLLSHMPQPRCQQRRRYTTFIAHFPIWIQCFACGEYHPLMLTISNALVRFIHFLCRTEIFQILH